MNYQQFAMHFDVLFDDYINRRLGVGFCGWDGLAIWIYIRHCIRYHARYYIRYCIRYYIFYYILITYLIAYVITYPYAWTVNFTKPLCLKGASNITNPCPHEKHWFSLGI